jgi:hypothetical protein
VGVFKGRRQDCPRPVHGAAPNDWQIEDLLPSLRLIYVG